MNRRAVAAATVAVVAAVAGLGVAWAQEDEYYDQQGNLITEEEYNRLFGPEQQVAPEEEGAPAPAPAPAAESAEPEPTMTDPSTRQDGF